MTKRYGFFRWGALEEASEERPPPRRSRGRKEIPTEEEALGTGIALNPASEPGYNWDFRIDEDGALMSTGGIDEYSKDMAFLTAREFGRLVGRIMNINEITDLEYDVEWLLTWDDRTESVRDLTLRQSKHHPDTLLMDVKLTASTGKYHETVIPVGN
jgi:hypothetical protein